MKITLRKAIFAILFISSFLPLLAYIDSLPAKIFDFESPENAAFLPALIIGYTGFILLWWQSVIGMRSLVGRLLVDWVWVNNIHKFIGRYGVLIIFLHPIFILISYTLPDSLELIIPNFTSQQGPFIFLGTVAFDLLLLIWITSAILRGKIKYRPWRYIHYLALPIFAFAYFHMSNLGTGVKSEAILQNYAHFLFATYILSLVYRLFRQLGINQSKFRLVSKEQITGDNWIYTFQADKKNRIMKALPGQFAYLQIGVFSEDHPFTILNIDTENNVVRFGIKSEGKFTKSLTRLTEGQQVYIDGPYGIFTRELSSEAPGTNNVFIAGGIGITPFLSHIQNNNHNIAYLFFGNRTESDIPFKETIDLSIEKTVHVLSEVGKDQTSYETGFITPDLLKKYISEPLNRYEYFVCGPPIMMQKVSEGLIANGVEKDSIHLEKFSI